MKKIIIFIFLYSVIILSSCIEKCVNPDFYSPSETSLLYFKVFDEGNSWTYINQDGTKTDSLFLKYERPYRNDGMILNTTVCLAFYERVTILHSLYLSRQQYIQCFFSTFSDSGIGKTSFTFRDGNPRGLFANFIFVNQTDTFEANILIIDSIDLPNGNRYYNVINHNNLWIAPNVGLIKFISYNERDTFYLNTFYPK